MKLRWKIQVGEWEKKNSRPSTCDTGLYESKKKKAPERKFYMMRQGQATSLVIKGINRPIQFQPITGEGIVEVDDKKSLFLKTLRTSGGGYKANS